MFEDTVRYDAVVITQCVFLTAMKMLHLKLAQRRSCNNSEHKVLCCYTLSDTFSTGYVYVL